LIEAKYSSESVGHSHGAVGAEYEALSRSG
jgi:hypothetical protein